MKIGEILKNSYLIDQTQLEQALNLQLSEESKLGEILVSYGYINNLQFYRNLAMQLDLEFVNILDEPCDPSLIFYENIDKYLNHNFLPHKMIDNKLIILTSSDPALLSENCLIKILSIKYDIIYKITSPNDIRWSVENIYSKNLTQDARNLLKFNASHSSKNVIIIILAIIIMIFFSFFSPKIFQYFFYLMNISYIINNLFKLLLFSLGSGIFSRSISIQEESYITEYPIYTILIPLYKEIGDLSYLINSLDNLEYPKTKLDIKFVLEEDDEETIQNVQSKKLPANYQIIKIPFSEPRTKAKACNYAIRFAKGKYLTIYDAEDIPDPLQLKKALIKFQNSPETLACIQAKLNYYNRDENILTNFFPIEYGIWFEFMLKGLEKLSLAIPLGGTSCHFKTEILKKIFYWDAYNVTEDAELGLRLFSLGYETSIIDSLTLEESPIFLSQWTKQRARWIKGYLQTYLTNFRYSLNIIRNFKYFVSLQFFIGIPCIAFIANLLTIFFSILIFVIGKQDIYFSDFTKNVAFLNLLASFIVPLVKSLIVIIKKRYPIKFNIILFPFYWILHSAAAFKGIKELFYSPFHWNKTTHGISKIKPQKEIILKNFSDEI